MTSLTVLPAGFVFLLFPVGVNNLPILAFRQSHDELLAEHVGYNLTHTHFITSQSVKVEHSDFRHFM